MAGTPATGSARTDLDNGYPPAVRHALSDFLKVLRNRWKRLASERKWGEIGYLYITGKGELPDLSEEGGSVGAWDGEWQAAAQKCADRLDVFGRPDLARQVRAAASDAPDMRAALDAAAKDTRRITPLGILLKRSRERIKKKKKAQHIAWKQYQAEKEAQRSALETYRANKQDELIALERTIEQMQWLLGQDAEEASSTGGAPDPAELDAAGESVVIERCRLNTDSPVLGRLEEIPGLVKRPTPAITVAPAENASTPNARAVPAEPTGPPGAEHSVYMAKDSEPGQTRPPAITEDTGNLMERVAIAIGEENTVRILAIAHNKRLSADQRMRQICEIDARFLGWLSPKWAKLLAVTPEAVRQTPWWREDRKRLMRPE